MIDAAAECARRGHRSIFIAPRPTRPFRSAGGQPTVAQVLDATDRELRVLRADVGAGVQYELGTAAYRASVLLGALRRWVPRGTPIIPSDDAAVWVAACAAAPAHPVIGVLHADDEYYYTLADRHHRDVAAFVCVSERIEATLRQRVPRLRVPVRRIPCGIALGARRELVASPQPRTRLIWVGRIEERQKRVSDLARILENMVAEGIDASLEVVGGGPDRDALEREFASRGVDSRVTWTGWLESGVVRQRMQNADVFLLPSNFEGMPVAAMEALAAGCGVVASQASGLDEFARHRDAPGCLRTFAVGDVKGAVAGLRALLAMSATARAGAARCLAEAEFSIEMCVSRYEELRPLLAQPFGSINGTPIWARGAWLTSLPIVALRRTRMWMSGVGRTSRLTPDHAA